MRQSERTARTRARLLRAARKVFGRRGYHAASLAEIAGEAGVSKGALYHNFPSKEDLFLALLDERLEERIRDIEEVFAGGEASEKATEAQVQEAALHAIEALKQSREWRVLFLEFVVHAAREREFAAEFADRIKRMRSGLTRVIKERTEALGIELAIPAEQLAICINGLGNGLAIESLSTPEEVPDELLGFALVSLLQGAAGESLRPDTSRP